MVRLETPRLLLRPTTASDRADLHRLEQDPEVMRHLHGGRPTPLDPREDAGFLMPRGEEPGVWAVIERQTGRFLGWVALPVEAGAGRLGYRFFRAFWGHGYATEAARAVMADAFERLGAASVAADTMTVNLASRRLMERLGMRYARTFFADFPEALPGSEKGDVEYVLTREAWQALRAERLSFVRATPADAARLAAHERRVADPRLYGPPLDHDACAREIAHNVFYFVEVDGALVATAAWKRREDGSAYLSNIAVHPDFRRCGVGRAAALFLLAEAKGCARVDLVTHPDNAAAMALYGSLGFAVESRKEDHFGDGEPRVVMVKCDRGVA
ncbi:MAG TPA: GNAT family N-acetyltransferase [Caulobacteraceae bacterium]|nr:GNAT family N-acetyltransferase [Caulobacteraceae bacterium]